jgi:hypothetical protein
MRNNEQTTNSLLSQVGGVAAPRGETIADDYVPDIGKLAEVVLGADTEKNRRHLRREMEKPPGKRLRGLFKHGGRIRGIPSMIRADLLRRAAHQPE